MLYSYVSSFSSSMSCLRVANAEDKSINIICIGCPVSSELYKSSKRESTRWFQYYGVYGIRLSYVQQHIFG